jgi:hypothetical protein
VERARARAEVLRKAGLNAYGAVAGALISERAQVAASEAQVEVFTRASDIPRFAVDLAAKDEEVRAGE